MPSQIERQENVILDEIIPPLSFVTQSISLLASAFNVDVLWFATTFYGPLIKSQLVEFKPLVRCSLDTCFLTR